MRKNKKISFSRRFKDKVLSALLLAATGVVCLLLVFVCGYILYRGLSHITLSFLTTKPSLIRDTAGILPNILNTLYIILITLVFVIPLGVGSAIYLTEYAKRQRVVNTIKLATETLAGIPSIVYGLVGMLIFVQFFSFGTSLLAGGMTLVIMTLPTIIRTTQESLKSITPGLREGALALGAGKWYMIRTVVIPEASDGIATGCILATGRIIGESAALLFTAGMANEILTISEGFSPGNAGSTLTVALYTYAKERGDFDSAFAIAVILLLIVFLINLLTKLVATLIRKRKG